MNKLNKAIALLSLLALLSVAVCVWESADSEAAIGSENNPKYIIGESNKAYPLAGSNDSVTGTIDFNQTALGYNTVADFYIGTDAASATSSVTVGSETTVANYKVTISSVTDNNGRYAVKVVAGTGAGEATIIIKLVATTKVNDNDTNGVMQESFWAIKVNYDGTAKTIVIEGATGDEKNQVSFSYGTTISMNAGVYAEEDKNNGYRMYAVGLPDGLAMVQGADADTWAIGGRISASFDVPTSENARTFIVYAISDAGDFLYKTFHYTIDEKPNFFGFTYKLFKDSSTEAESAPYIFVSDGSSLKLRIAKNDASPSMNYTVTVNGNNLTATSGEYVIGISGTGTMTVKITGSYLDNPVAVETFNIYVVSQIFDSDLSPTVKSA